MKRVRKVIATLLIVASVITVNSIQANASTTGWQGSNSEGWWYVDNAGSYVTGWEYIDGQWYYFSEAGWMLSNITIDGYYLTSTGAWDGNSGTTSSTNSSTVTNNSSDSSNSGSAVTNNSSSSATSNATGTQRMPSGAKGNISGQKIEGGAQDKDLGDALNNGHK